MSRLNKLSKIKKQKIKETIIGLSISISIGLVGSLGSYAYFSDKVETDNGINITMGTLDVGIGNGFNLTEFKKGDEKVYTTKFLIENTGTLDEILTLKFDNIKFNGDKDNDNLSKIIYTLNIGDVYSIESNLLELSTKGVNIGRLNSGDSISCTATLKNNGIDPSYEKDTEITFDLVVEGVQINDPSVQGGGAN